MPIVDVGMVLGFWDEYFFVAKVSRHVALRVFPLGSETMVCWTLFSVNILVRSWFISKLTLCEMFAQHSF